YLSWGDVECMQDYTIRYQRTALMISEELPSILKRLLSPPRNHDSHDVRAMGGRRYLEEFVIDCMQDIGVRELASLKPTIQRMKGDLSEE
ncbi:hypothetical protein PAXINDRAFT_27102, partial [Paxillus involutus ATCC 200175]